MSQRGDVEVALSAADGWRLGGLLRVPQSRDPLPGVVLVHASHHERDAFTYGVSLPDRLAARGLASLRFDIRGRGTSAGPIAHHRMAPLQRRAVALDVAAAIDRLASVPEVGTRPVAVVGEQDTASAVVDAVADRPQVAALVLLSPRLDRSAVEALRRRAMPTYALVSSEDRRSLLDATLAYVAGDADGSRLDVVEGLGFGTTMFMARAFEQPDEPLLEDLIVDWLDERLRRLTGE